MVYYIIPTLLGMCLAIVTKLYGIESGSAAVFIVFTGLSVIVTIITIVIQIEEHDNNYRKVKTRRVSINLAIEELRGTVRQSDSIMNKSYDHEIQIVDKITKAIPAGNTGRDSILSKNLLTQMPDLKASDVASKALGDIDSDRHQVINSIKHYNETVESLSQAQGCSVIVRVPLIKYYNIPDCLSIKSIDDLENIEIVEA